MTLVCSRWGQTRPAPNAAASACTTWRGRYRRYTTSPPGERRWPASARSWARATTAPRSRSTARTLTATSSRSCGSCRATSGATLSTKRRPIRSTSTPSSPAGVEPSGSALRWFQHQPHVEVLLQRPAVGARLDVKRLVAAGSGLAGDGQETRQVDGVLATKRRLEALDGQLDARRNVWKLDRLLTSRLRPAHAELDLRPVALLQRVLVDLVGLD